MNPEFSKKLKDTRTEQGFTQQELAVELDLGLRQYQRIEQGQKYPSIEQIITLNKILKHDFFSHFVTQAGIENGSMLQLNIEQTAASRVMLRGLSELLGHQQGKSVTGVTADLNRVLRDEVESLKSQLLGLTGITKKP